MIDPQKTGVVLTFSYGSYILDITVCELNASSENFAGYRKTISQNSYMTPVTDNLNIESLTIAGQKNYELEFDFLLSSNKFRLIHDIHNQFIEDKKARLLNAYVDVNRVPLQGSLQTNSIPTEQFIQLSDRRLEDPLTGGFQVYSIYLTSLTPIDDIFFNPSKEDLYLFSMTARTL